MNKTIQRLVTLFFIVATVTGHINAARQPTRKRPVRMTRTRKRVAPASPAAKVNKEVSILDQIVEQARIIVMATGTQANRTRANAKKQLNDLMKDLDPKINEVIAEDIEIIKNTTARNKPASRAAYRRLIALVNSINAQANVVNTMEEGRKAIERAPTEINIAQQVQNVQAAEAQAVEASKISQIVGGIQSALAAPGRYFFGEDRTAAKTAFEVVVGGAVIGALAYGAYALSPETWQNLYGRMRGTAAQPTVTPQPKVQPTLIERYNPITGELETEAMQAAGAEIGAGIRKAGAEYKRRTIPALAEQEELVWTPEHTEEARALAEQARIRARQAGQAYKERTIPALAEQEEYAILRGELEPTKTMRKAGVKAGKEIQRVGTETGTGIKAAGATAYEYAQRAKQAASKYFYPETVEETEKVVTEEE